MTRHKPGTTPAMAVDMAQEVSRIDADLMIPGRGDPIKNASLVWNGNKIVFAGESKNLPEEYSFLQSTDHVPVLMPGMWDCHGKQNSTSPRTKRSHTNKQSSPLHGSRQHIPRQDGCAPSIPGRRPNSARPRRDAECRLHLRTRARRLRRLHLQSSRRRLDPGTHRLLLVQHHQHDRRPRRSSFVPMGARTVQIPRPGHTRVRG